LHKCSGPLTQYFGTSGFGYFLTFFSADPLNFCQVGLETVYGEQFSGFSRDV